MKKVLTLIILFSGLSGFSQNSKSLFLELLGSGGLASINYEHIFLDNPKTDFSYRVGFSFAPIDKNNGTALIFPVMLNAVYGSKSHKADFGIGQGFTITTKGQPFVTALAAVSYRYQPRKKKLYLKISYTPLLSYVVNFQWQHWGGAGIAYILN